MSTTATTTNAGKRLYAILRAIKDAKPQGNVGTLLSSVLDIPSDDVAGIYRHYASLLTLVDDVENRLKALDDPNREHYLKCFTAFKNATHGAALQSAPTQIQNQISESDLSLLNLAGQRLDQVQTELLLSKSEVASLQSDAAALFQKISASDLPAELKIVILDLLESVRRTLSEYQIRGAEGLKRVLAESMGRLMLDKDLVAQSNKHTDFRSFLDLLSKLNALFTAATNSHKIGAMLGDVIARIED